MKPQGKKKTQEVLRDFKRDTLEANLQPMRLAVKYRKGQKQLKLIALYQKNTLARPPIYDEAYPEKLCTASPGSPV